MSTPTDRDPELPDTALFWRWVGKATRPVIGWVLIGIGALAVLIGYLGVSREALVAKQLPYLISGGIAGLLIGVVGAYILGTEELRKDSGRLDRLEHMVAELHGVLLSRPDAPATIAAGVATGTAVSGAVTANHANGSENGAAPLIALPGIDGYIHRAGCPMVDGKPGATTVSRATARRRKLSPCPLCEPVLVDA